jgi:bifunctional UDP-N-acetylglucosamine pyrophosphorylase/glucosamine-1-phosphate N-acetyltransferase
MAPIITSKPSLKFAGKPLIRHQINAAQQAGLSRFVIVANKDNIADLKTAVAGLREVKIEFAIQEKPAGMADAILAASNLLPDEPFILCGSDDIVESAAFSRLTGEYEKTNDCFGYVTAFQVLNYFPGGYLVIDGTGKICRIVEKPRRGEEPSKFLNIVLHLFSHPQKLFDYLMKAETDTDDSYERILDRIIQDGNPMRAIEYKGTWQTIKYPWHILEAMDLFLKPLKRQISPSAQISDKAVIDGNVVIEDNVSVLEGAIIRGPTYIGRNSIIGNNVLIRQANLGDNCVIGFSTEIKHSWIGDRCWFHSNYIGDSIIEDDCSFGAGTVTANLRLDNTRIKVTVGDEEIETGHDKLGSFVGKGSRFGIHVSLLPGVRVGAGSLVGAHVCLPNDLPSGTMALAESRYRALPYQADINDDRRYLFGKPGE